MKLSRFNNDRLGVVQSDHILDVTDALDLLPQRRWAAPAGDPLFLHFDAVLQEVRSLLASAPRIDLTAVKLCPPVAQPSKIIGAPVNYHAHLKEAVQDAEINRGDVVHKIDEIGCFLKACSAMVGPGAIIQLPFADERVDHEAEVAVVIGKPAQRVLAHDAMDYVAGYSLALDMTVRGKQHRSMRKSCDGFAVLGPWLVTADEISDPGAIPFELTINGQVRQKADTSLLIRSIPELIEMCSAFYTLLPGDVIMTGTPAGVSPVSPGDRIEVTSPFLGTLAVSIG